MIPNAIGTNAQENWDILDQANPYDYWFHLKEHPSGYVILKLPSEETKLNLRSLTQCAILCKDHSKYRGQKNLQIIECHKKTYIRSCTYQKYQSH